jgi:hypothetical protein
MSYLQEVHIVSVLWEGRWILMEFGNVGSKQKFVVYFSLLIIQDYVLQHTYRNLKVISFVINFVICHSNELYFRGPVYFSGVAIKHKAIPVSQSRTSSP